MLTEKEKNLMELLAVRNKDNYDMNEDDLERVIRIQIRVKPNVQHLLHASTYYHRILSDLTDSSIHMT